MTKVSVIIPNYNRAAIVGETIENMLRQSLPPHEVIVVDDGSTDSSVEVIRSFGDRVKLIQQKNQGPGAARNTGLKIASGQFIQLMDSDDLASLNKLEAQTKTLLNNKADIVYSPWVRVFLQAGTATLQDVVLQQQPLPDSSTIVQHFLTGWSMVFQQCLLRADFVKGVGLYRTDLYAWEDGDFFLRMLLAQPKVVFSDAPLTIYRLDDYGKLTASGIASTRKLEDCSRFLVSAYQTSRQQPWSQPAVAHLAFLSTVWKTLSLLERSDSSDRDLASQLSAILQAHYDRGWVNRYAAHRPLAVYAKFTGMMKGLQQRLKGHRWSSAYRPGALSVRQKELIAELGLRIA